MFHFFAFYTCVLFELHLQLLNKGIDDDDDDCRHLPDVLDSNGNPNREQMFWGMFWSCSYGGSHMLRTFRNASSLLIARLSCGKRPSPCSAAESAASLANTCLCNGHKHRCLLVIHNSSFVSSADTRRHLRSAKHHLHVLALPAQQLRPSGVLGCWPDGVGLSPVFYPGFNEQHRLL